MENYASSIAKVIAKLDGFGEKTIYGLAVILDRLLDYADNETFDGIRMDLNMMIYKAIHEGKSPRDDRHYMQEPFPEPRPEWKDNPELGYLAMIEFFDHRRRLGNRMSFREFIYFSVLESRIV